MYLVEDESGSVSCVVGVPGLLERPPLQLARRHLGRDGDRDAVVPRLGVQVHEHHHLARDLRDSKSCDLKNLNSWPEFFCDSGKLHSRMKILCHLTNKSFEKLSLVR